MTKNYILKPFEIVQEKTLLLSGFLIGVTFCIIQLFTQTRSIAILKQVSLKSAPILVQTLADFVITTTIMTMALFILGKIINNKTRFIDILNTVLIARICLDLGVLFDINGYFSNISNLLIENISNPETLLITHRPQIIYMTIVSLSAIFLLVAFAYYIYQGFKTATHLKTKTPIIAFILVILIVDILTRFITRLY
ncbi:hypothetical protein [Myroides sp. N17-2]|uniref:hypothetical protein n=1 Tax=Myroides sp. N17-2 TaxID=2030799 RepID=UPI000EFBFD97|nr:hypothetical protein [Myroides sp. N17-2]